MVASGPVSGDVPLLFEAGGTRRRGTDMANALYEDLVRTVRSGNAVIVVGTGVSIGATANSSTSSWRGLLQYGLKRVTDLDPNSSKRWVNTVRAEIESDDLDEILSAAEKISRKLKAPNGPEWRRWLRESYEGVQVVDSSVPEAIVALNLPILTTNYDDVLQSVVSAPPVTNLEPEVLQRILRGDDKSIGYLHGHYRSPQSVVLGIRSYQTVLGNKALQATEKAVAILGSLIFVGMGAGLDDPNWSALFDHIEESLPNSEYRHFRLCVNAEVNLLSQKHKNSPIYPIGFGASKEQLANFLRKVGKDSGRVVRPRRTPATAGKARSGARVPRSATSKAMNPAPRHRVALAIIRDNKSGSVVLVQRQIREGNLDWSFPAGLVRPLRDPKQVVADQVREETGLICKVKSLIGERMHPHTKLKCLYFEMSILDGILANGDPDENLDVRWVRFDRLYDYVDVDDVYEPVRQYLTTNDRQKKRV